MAKAPNGNIHRVHGLPPRDSTPKFDELVDVKNKLKEELGIGVFQLDQLGHMNLESLVREEMNPHPIPDEIKGRLKQMEEYGVVPLVYRNEGDDYRLMVGIKNEKTTMRNIYQMGMEFPDFSAGFFSIGSKEIKYVLLSPRDYDVVGRLIVSADARKEYLNSIDEDSAAEEIYFSLLKTAIAIGGTDVHLEHLKEGSNRARIRIDGVLQEFGQKIPDARLASLINVVKIRANIPIDEKVIPQDGSTIFDKNFFDEYSQNKDDNKKETYIQKFPEIRGQLGGYSLRVATMPTNLGEKVAVRILNSEAESFDLKELGYDDETRKKIESLTQMPQGLILVSGPTGSGKTTTLYSMINAVNSPKVNIVTIEDPIEKNIPGVNQSSINPKRGWNFENSLSAYLRQDPDIIFVGEIRNAQTAQTALEASGTGHLVFSTIHTNDSVSVIQRLMDLGIEKSLIQDNVSAIIAQRLYRKLCPECKEDYDAKDEINELLNEYVLKEKFTLFRGREDGCDHCRGMGYRGRRAVAEMWILGDQEKEMILAGEMLKSRYYDVAFRGGLVPLVCSGFDLAVKGVTSISEVLEQISPRGEFLSKKNFIKEQIKRYPPNR